MALNKNTLKNNLLAAMNAASASNASTPLQRREALAESLANAIDTYIKEADGVYQQGTLVAGNVPVTRVSATINVKLN